MRTAGDAFASRPVFVTLLRLSLPAMGGLVINATYNVADSLFVGRFVGTEGLAAVGLNFPVMILLISAGILIGVGSAALISRRLGARDSEGARRAFGNSLALILAVGAAVTVLGLPFAEPIARGLGASPRMLGGARQYFTIVAAGATFLVANQTLNNIVYSVGAGSVGFAALGGSSMLNILLDWLFLGAFGWGVTGAALATVISQACATLGLVAFFARGRTPLTVRLGWDRADRREILRIGIVAAIRTLTVVVLGLVVNHQARRVAGDLGVAVASVVFRVVSLVVLPAIGINQAYLPIAAYNVGADNRARVLRATWQAVALALGVCFPASALVIGNASGIARLFNPDPDFVATAAVGFRTAFLLTPFLIFNLVGSALYQAVGNARRGLLISLSRMTFFIIPLLLILPGFFGLRGIWMSFPFGELGAATFAVLMVLPQLRALYRRDAGAPEPSRAAG